MTENYLFVIHLLTVIVLVLVHNVTGQNEVANECFKHKYNTLPEILGVRLSCLDNQNITVNRVEYKLPIAPRDRICITSEPSTCSATEICKNKQCCTGCCSNVPVCTYLMSLTSTHDCKGAKGSCVLRVPRIIFNKDDPTGDEDCRKLNSCPDHTHTGFFLCYPTWVEVYYDCWSKTSTTTRAISSITTSAIEEHEDVDITSTVSTLVNKERVSKSDTTTDGHKYDTSTDSSENKGIESTVIDSGSSEQMTQDTEVYTTTDTASTTETTSEPNSLESIAQMSVTVVAGAAAGGFLICAMIVVLLVFIFMRRRRIHNQKPYLSSLTTPTTTHAQYNNNVYNDDVIIAADQTTTTFMNQGNNNEAVSSELNNGSTAIDGSANQTEDNKPVNTAIDKSTKKNKEGKESSDDGMVDNTYYEGFNVKAKPDPEQNSGRNVVQKNSEDEMEDNPYYEGGEVMQLNNENISAVGNNPGNGSDSQNEADSKLTLKQEEDEKERNPKIENIPTDFAMTENPYYEGDVTPLAASSNDYDQPIMANGDITNSDDYDQPIMANEDLTNSFDYDQPIIPTDRAEETNDMVENPYYEGQAAVSGFQGNIGDGSAQGVQVNGAEEVEKEGNYVYTYEHFKLEGRERQPSKK